MVQQVKDVLQPIATIQGGAAQNTDFMSCIVLAGGQSKRLGRNKLFETIGHQNLIERVISRLSSFEADIIIVKGQDSILPQLSQYPSVKIVKDIYAGRGSLGGIYTGLAESSTLYNLVVAADMPFLNFPLLCQMFAESQDYDVVVPRGRQTPFEPLHAIYSKNCILPLERLILENRFMILELFPFVKVRYVETAEIDRIDPQHLSFFNINAEADLELGRKLEKKVRTGGFGKISAYQEENIGRH